MEFTLAACWSEVLRLEEVGINDNFFSLGGDSLHMTQIASRVRQRCGVELSIERFFSDPTIAGHSRILQEAMTERPGAHGNIVESRADSQPRPRSYSPGTLSPAAAPRPTESGSIKSVTIATAGRPAALQRCLAGLIGNLQAYARDLRVWVIDGSINPSVQAANRQVAETIARRTGYRIDVVCATEIRRYSQELSDAVADEDLLGFALPGRDEFAAGSRLGASRNLQLLATAGEAFLSIDDDTDFRFAFPSTLASAKQGIAANLLGDDPAEVWSYRDRETLLREIPFDNFDLIAGHQEFLGRDLADIIDHGALPIGDRIVAQQFGKVLVTLSGLVGDCGWGTPSRFLFLDDVSFKRLAESDDSYHRTTTSREMLRVAPSRLISGRVENLIAATFGADGRSLLPPFVPVGRGSDVVFGRLVKTIEPSAAFGHVPAAILHLPIENRRFSPGEVLRSSSSIDIKDLLCGILADQCTNGMKRLNHACQIVGLTLVDIASQPLPEFQEYLRWRKRLQVERDVSILEHRLKADIGSAMCRRDISAFIDALKKSLSRPAAAIPAELVYGRDVTDAVQVTRRLLGLYGRLLCVWPDLINHALRLRQTERGLFA